MSWTLPLFASSMSSAVVFVCLEWRPHELDSPSVCFINVEGGRFCLLGDRMSWTLPLFASSMSRAVVFVCLETA